jgi:tight adherence protein B
VGLALLIFLTVTLGITAGLHLLSDLIFPEATRVRRRVAQEFGKDPGQAAISPLFKNLDKLASDMSRDEEGDEPVSPSARQRFWSHWRTSLEQADLKLTVQHVVNIGLCLGFFAGAVAFWLGGVIVGVPAGIAAMVLPFALVAWKRKTRREKFLKQLPAAFDLMGRIIRAGQSIPEALRAVAEAFPNPISNEFSRCQNQLNLGLSPEVTFREMALRSGILEMQIFVMALLIQRQAGGSLSEVLERLANVIRARLKLRKQIRSLTAEGRLQGWTLVVLPFIVFGAMMVINHDYAVILLSHTRLLGAMGIAMLCGILWIRRIVNIEI